MRKVINKIIIIMIIIIMGILFSFKSYAGIEDIKNTTIADITLAEYGYEELSKVNLDFFKTLTLTDVDARQRHAQVACMEKPAEPAVGTEGFKILAYIDINKDGNNYNSGTITTSKGTFDLADSENLARLAYISYKAEQVGYVEPPNDRWGAWRYVWAFRYIWEYGGLRNDAVSKGQIPLPSNNENDPDSNSSSRDSNSAYHDADYYVTNGVTENGKVCKARIIICGYGGVQAIAIMSRNRG